ncbi:MAG: hypothetical protein RMK80_05140 [Pseudobdellovibrionaceae bacterium]|nr:hypothetical protein [Pseudobdellovibrionaceae bacterium]
MFSSFTVVGSEPFWRIYSSIRDQLISQRIIEPYTWIILEHSVLNSLWNTVTKIKSVFPSKKKVLFISGASALQKNIHLMLSQLGLEIVRLPWTGVEAMDPSDWSKDYVCIVSPREHELTGDYLRDIIKTKVSPSCRVGLIFYSKCYGMESFSTFYPWEIVVARITSSYFLSVCGERVELSNSYPYLDLAPFHKNELNIFLNQPINVGVLDLSSERRSDPMFNVYSGRWGGMVSGHILARASSNFIHLLSAQQPKGNVMWRALNFDSYLKEELEWLEPEELVDSENWYIRAL